MQIQKIHVVVLQNWITSTWKYNINYNYYTFKFDKDLLCMDMNSTFHHLVIIYQSFNVKVSWKFWNPTNLEHVFIHFSYVEIPQTLCTTYNKLNEVLYDFKMQFK
jgi:hypothetical protein